MLKMLMDPMGGICMTNDGNAILREITVQHPAAKSLIEVARTQDEEVGDGTTSVIILGESPLPLNGLYHSCSEENTNTNIILFACSAWICGVVRNTQPLSAFMLGRCHECTSKTMFRN